MSLSLSSLFHLLVFLLFFFWGSHDWGKGGGVVVQEKVILNCHLVREKTNEDEESGQQSCERI